MGTSDATESSYGSGGQESGLIPRDGEGRTDVGRAALPLSPSLLLHASPFLSPPHPGHMHGLSFPPFFLGEGSLSPALLPS